MDSMEHRLDGRQPRGGERQIRIVNPKITLPYFLPNTLQYGRQEDFRHHSLHIPDNCRRRGRRRQCKFFWPV